MKRRGRPRDALPVVQRFTPLLADTASPLRHAVGKRWFVDETYVKVAGAWRYVYRAIDEHGQVIDVYTATEQRNSAPRTMPETLRPLPPGYNDPRRSGSSGLWLPRTAGARVCR